MNPFISEIVKKATTDAAATRVSPLDLELKELVELRNTTVSDRYNLSSLLIGSKVWQSLISSPSIRAHFEPNSKLKEVERGRLGKIFDINIISDAFYSPEERVAKPDSIIAVSHDHSYVIGSTIVAVVNPSVLPVAHTITELVELFNKQLSGIQLSMVEKRNGVNNPPDQK